MGALTLNATIESYGPAAAILLTEEQVAQLCCPKSPPVIVTIGGRSARLRVGRMGGDVMIGFSEAARAALGVEVGDEVEARVELDAGERTVDVPEALQAALDADPEARAAFEALAYSRRKEAAPRMPLAPRGRRRARPAAPDRKSVV